MDIALWASPLWYVVVALAVVGAMLYYYFGEARQRAQEQLADERDPVKRWAKGVYGIITGGIDYAYKDKRRLRTVLRERWGIKDAEEFHAYYRNLSAEQPQDQPKAAWCWVRAVNLARMAAGARFIDYGESWRLIAPVLPRIQTSFAGWEDLGQNYQARDTWLREQSINPQDVENVEDNLNALRATVWRTMAFDQPLQLTQWRAGQHAIADRLRSLWDMAAAAIDSAIRRARQYATADRLRAPWGMAAATTDSSTSRAGQHAVADRLRALWGMAVAAIDSATKFWLLLLVAAFAITAGLLLAEAYLSSNPAERELVGTWLGERGESGSIDGKKFDTMRWLMVIRPDRTATRTVRWYLGRRKQAEVVTQYEWSVSAQGRDQGLLWQLVCKENPPGYECTKSSYQVAVNANEIRYSSGKAAFVMRKVSADYRLP